MFSRAPKKRRDDRGRNQQKEELHLFAIQAIESTPSWLTGTVPIVTIDAGMFGALATRFNAGAASSSLQMFKIPSNSVSDTLPASIQG